MCTNFRTKSKFPKKKTRSPFIKIIIVIKNLSVTVTFFSYSRQCSTLKHVHIGEKQFADFSISEKSQKREDVSRKWEKRKRERNKKRKGKVSFVYILESLRSLSFFSPFLSRWSFFLPIFFFPFLCQPPPFPLYVIEIIMSNSFVETPTTG